MKSENGKMVTYILKKKFPTKENVKLAWTTETLDVDNDVEDGQFTVKYDGKHVGTMSVSLNGTTGSPAVTALLQNRGDLFAIAGAVGRDLDQAFPEPPPDSETCCCETNCLGSTSSCGSSALLRSDACAAAEACVGSKCWNSFCIGCCDISDCNCACAPNTDFLCYCVVTGDACRCDTYCV
jgi:hypothetical protein